MTDSPAPLNYRDAGVDIDAADDAKSRIRKLVESTFTEGTRGSFGGFGGMFRVPSDASNALLVASADGVGTKVKVAIESGQNSTVGHDLVNHCVNDILVQGAVPLFFLDYLAFGRLDPSVVEAVVAGVAAGCRENGCALIGGETAEMPGLYTPPDYDLAGFVVGYVNEDSVLGADRVRDGDVLVGLASSGLHTNGYSLARRIVSDRLGLAIDDEFPGEGASTADVLLRVHRSYLGVLRSQLSVVHAMAHITGGGLPGNLDRVLPADLDAYVKLGSWEVPNLFRVLGEAGDVGQDELFRAFNMGVGMVVVCDPTHVSTVIGASRSGGIPAWELGHIGPGTGKVRLVEDR